ncbi:MAG: hypothetical protein IT190_03125 [Microbacteriaceae bacterium]|nr:hypothetical protein [Microbacteriaceae bacterium]
MMFNTTPTPPPDFDLNSVTPGWVGFAVTAIVVLATIALIFDMVRRIRRIRYRAEIREKLAEEGSSGEQSTDN